MTTDSWLEKISRKEKIVLPPPNENISLIIFDDKPIKPEYLKDVDLVCFANESLNPGNDYIFSPEKYQKNPNFASIFDLESVRLMHADVFFEQKDDTRDLLASLKDSLLYKSMTTGMFLEGARELTITRRHFLRGLIFVGIGGYFAPTAVNIEMAKRDLPQYSGMDTENIFYLNRLKNLIRAQKINAISKKIEKENGNKPKIVVLIKSTDTTLQKAFKLKPTERQELMDNLLVEFSKRTPEKSRIQMIEDSFYIFPNQTYSKNNPDLSSTANQWEDIRNF